MKTPLNKLRSSIEEIENSIFALSAPENELSMLKQFKSMIDGLLEYEEKEIKSAFSAGITGNDNRNVFFDNKYRNINEN